MKGPSSPLPRMDEEDHASECEHISQQSRSCLIVYLQVFDEALWHLERSVISSDDFPPCDSDTDGPWPCQENLPTSQTNSAVSTKDTSDVAPSYDIGGTLSLAGNSGQDSQVSFECYSPHAESSVYPTPLAPSPYRQTALTDDSRSSPDFSSCSTYCSNPL